MVSFHLQIPITSPWLGVRGGGETGKKTEREDRQRGRGESKSITLTLYSKKRITYTLSLRMPSGKWLVDPILFLYHLELWLVIARGREGEWKEKKGR